MGVLASERLREQGHRSGSVTSLASSGEMLAILKLESLQNSQFRLSKVKLSIFISIN